MDSDTTWRPMSGFDELDQRIVQALQVDGRAPFRRIGEVLGVSDQTVARRYGRMRSTATFRVVGLADPLRVGLTMWLLRVRSTPDAAGAIGEALARRTDTRWVSLLSGGTEIFCLAQAATPGTGDAPLLQKLPRTPQVLQVTAHAMLHVFFGRDLSPVGRKGPLTPDEVRALIPQDAPPRPLVASMTEPVRIGQGDLRLFELLSIDGRTPTAELAAVTGWSRSTVRRRLSELRASGALYYDLDFNRRALLPDLRVALWMEVEPSRLAEAGAALAAHQEVAFAGATTGTTNIYATVNCRDSEALYRYVTGPVAALPGVRHTETAPIHRTLKSSSPRLDPASPHLAESDRT